MYFCAAEACTDCFLNRKGALSSKLSQGGHDARAVTGLLEKLGMKWKLLASLLAATFLLLPVELLLFASWFPYKFTQWPTCDQWLINCWRGS